MCWFPNLTLESPPRCSDVGPVSCRKMARAVFWTFQVKESAYKRQFNSSLLVTRGLNSESCPDGVVWCVVGHVAKCVSEIPGSV